MLIIIKTIFILIVCSPVEYELLFEELKEKIAEHISRKVYISFCTVVLLIFPRTELTCSIHLICIFTFSVK